MSLGFRGFRAYGLGLGLRLVATDLVLGRAPKLRVSRAQSLGFRLGFYVRSDRFRARAGL